jgi:renalase
MRIGIIDAGMAGLCCAQALRHQDHNAIVFDKSRGLDGRVSTRCIDTPLGDAAFDQGAQELTARAPDENFAGAAEEWNKSFDADPPAREGGKMPVRIAEA